MKVKDLLDSIKERIANEGLHYDSDVIVTEEMFIVMEDGEEPIDYENWKEELFDRFAHEIIANYSIKLKDEPSLMQTVEIGKELRSDIVMFFEGLEDSFYDAIGGENLIIFRDSLLDLINISIYEDSEVKRINFFNDSELHDLIYDDCIECEDKEACPIREEFEVCVVLDKQARGSLWG